MRAGNRQIAHYGGDSGVTADYRKGTLYFYNNSIVSTRTDRTTIVRLSTNQERCDFRNNIAYVAAAGSTLSLLDDAGIMDLSHNWLKPGWVNSFAGASFTGTVNNDGTSVQGASPGFADEPGQNYKLAAGSTCINAGTFPAPAVFPNHDVLRQYVKHQSSEARPSDGSYDIGAYEFASGVPPKLLITTTTLPNGTVGAIYNTALQATGGVTPYHWSVTSGSLPQGLGITDSGIISGTPATSGTSTFIVQVVDAQSADNDIQQLSLAIQNPNRSAGEYYNHHSSECKTQQVLQPGDPGDRRRRAIFVVHRLRQPAARSFSECKHRLCYWKGHHHWPIQFYSEGRGQPGKPWQRRARSLNPRDTLNVGGFCNSGFQLQPGSSKLKTGTGLSQIRPVSSRLLQKSQLDFDILSCDAAVGPITTCSPKKTSRAQHRACSGNLIRPRAHCAD